jgi:small subunit ribosomal protein S1
VGTRLKRKVVKVTGSGAFVELEEGIDGFLHGDDLYWTKKIKHIGSEIKADDEVEVIVIKVDTKNRNVKLGVKQLSEDPWKSFAATYKVGSIVEGEVSSVTDFGVFVKVPGDIEGLIHKSNLIKNKDENPDEVLKTYKEGDPIKAVVWELQPDKQKLAFSLRDYERKMEREEISRYMSAGESDGSTFTLGDALKSKSGEAANPSE